MKTVQTSKTTEIKTETFGVCDSRGREIGAQVKLVEATFTEATTEELTSRWTYDTAPGTYFQFDPHATRDGVRFGAIPQAKGRGENFTTAAERDAAIVKYLAGARKRAAKAAK